MEKIEFDSKTKTVLHDIYRGLSNISEELHLLNEQLLRQNALNTKVFELSQKSIELSNNYLESIYSEETEA